MLHGSVQMVPSGERLSAAAPRQSFASTAPNVIFARIMLRPERKHKPIQEEQHNTALTHNVQRPFVVTRQSHPQN